MTLTLDLVLLIVAFIAFLLAALNMDSDRIRFIPLGLALWVLTFITP